MERAKCLSWMFSPPNKRFYFCTRYGGLGAHAVSYSDTGDMTITFNNSIYSDTSERGAATAEYAIATVAAAGFAGLLAIVLKSNPVQSLLTDLISGALSIVT